MNKIHHSLIFSFLLCFCLGACDKPTNDGSKANPPAEHSHTFAVTWDSDDTYHWHHSTCGHPDAISDKAEHVFGDWLIDVPASEEEEGRRHRVCEICLHSVSESIPRLEHVHSFEDGWTFDETSHWHASTCGHDVIDGQEPHDFEESTVAPTFEEEGYLLHSCKVCDYEYKTDIVDCLEHHYSDTLSYDENGHFYPCIDEGYPDLKAGYEAHSFEDVVISPTFREQGYTRHTCNVCGYYYDDSFVEKREEHDVPTLSSDGKTITYGYNPKTIVSDSSLVSRLNNLAASDDSDWILYNGQYYHRKKSVRDIAKTYSDRIGLPFAITKQTDYWFKVEPIQWRVLSKIGTHDYFVISKDLQGYYSFGPNEAKELPDGKCAPQNNYEHSSVRAWISSTYYDSAFRFGDSHIKLSTIENPGSVSGSYWCEYASTQDYVFVPSLADLTNASYGFKASSENSDALRTMYVTNYLQVTTWIGCNNAMGYFSDKYENNTTWWWTRTAVEGSSDTAYRVERDGKIGTSSARGNLQGLRLAMVVTL